MQEVQLSAERRTVSTKGELNALRKLKKVPGIVYGGSKDTVSVAVPKKDLQNAMHTDAGMNAIITLKQGSAADNVLVHDIQYHPVSREIIHVDFHRINLTEKIHVKVPVHLTGEAVGHEMGGVVDHVSREIEVECLPADIPPHFDVDITGLNIGEAIIVKEISLPPAIKLLSDPEAFVVHVVTADKEEPKPEPVAEEVAAEPEVIGKGKEKEEGEEAKAEKVSPKESAGGEKEKK